MGTRYKAASEFAEKLKDEYDIIVPNVETPVRLLSGGNLQRVILGGKFQVSHLSWWQLQPTRAWT